MARWPNLVLPVVVVVVVVVVGVVVVGVVEDVVGEAVVVVVEVVVEVVAGGDFFIIAFITADGCMQQSKSSGKPSPQRSCPHTNPS